MIVVTPATTASGRSDRASAKIALASACPRALADFRVGFAGVNLGGRVVQDDLSPAGSTSLPASRTGGEPARRSVDPHQDFHFPNSRKECGTVAKNFAASAVSIKTATYASTVLFNRPGNSRT